MLKTTLLEIFCKWSSENRNKKKEEGQEAVEEKMSVADIVGLNLISFLITFALFLKWKFNWDKKKCYECADAVRRGCGNCNKIFQFYDGRVSDFVKS